MGATRGTASAGMQRRGRQREDVAALRVGGAGLAAVAVSYGLARHGYGLFVPAFRQEFHLSSAAVGLLGSAGYAAYLATLLVTGAITSRVGPRLPVVLGCVTAAAGMAAVALASGPVALAVGVVLAAASSGWTWAPFSDAVPRLVPAAGQDRALSMVSTGTAFALVTAGAVALLASGAWRPAWAVFAALALLAAMRNARVLPAGPPPGARAGRAAGWRWFLCRRSARLFAVTFGLSLGSSAYWTYAPDLVQAHGLPSSSAAVLWIVTGLTGAAGMSGGNVAHRLGLRAALTACLIAVAAALALLAVLPGSWTAALVSAAIFGAAFMVGYALIVLWSQRMFATHPSAGLTATILCGAAGFITGPAAFGALADRTGLATAIATASAITLATALVRPTS